MKLRFITRLQRKPSAFDFVERRRAVIGSSSETRVQIWPNQICTTKVFRVRRTFAAAQIVLQEAFGLLLKHSSGCFKNCQKKSETLLQTGKNHSHRVLFTLMKLGCFSTILPSFCRCFLKENRKKKMGIFFNGPMIFQNPTKKNHFVAHFKIPCLVVQNNDRGLRPLTSI